jgi:hypothetical protein
MMRQMGMGGVGEDPYGDMHPYGGGMGDTPPPKEATILNSQEEIDAFLLADGGDSAVLGYFETPAQAEELEIFKEVAQTLGRSHRFAYTTEEEVIESAKLSDFAVYAYRPADMISEKYGEKLKTRFPDSIMKKESLGRFVEDKALPLVGLKRTETRQRYEYNDLPELTLFTEVDLDRNMKMFQYYANRMRKVAVDMMGKMNFNIADRTEMAEFMTEAYGISPDAPVKVPRLGIRKETLFYLPLEELKFSTGSLATFVADFDSGKIEGKEIKGSGHGQDYGDEREPAYSAIITLTTDNFDRVVNDDVENDVMIEFYAPWCGKQCTILFLYCIVFLCIL